MKVLFIGEGRHDIGDPDPHPSQPRPAQGTIPTLARRCCTGLSADSVALAWSEIRRFNPAGAKRGYEAKVPAAALLATRRFGCTGTICVADEDNRPERRAALEEGAHRAGELFPGHRLAVGLAVRSVEAWVLGVPSAIAEELGLEEGIIHQQYPAGVHVEALSERSGKEEHRPKRLLERIAQLAHRHDCTHFRQAVAERTDVTVLATRCPQGFAPFLQALVGTFGS